MNYSKGEKVLIKKNLKGTTDVVSGMLEYQGKIAEITQIDGNQYKIDLDSGDFYWYDSNFEGLAEAESFSQYLSSYTTPNLIAFVEYLNDECYIDLNEDDNYDYGGNVEDFSKKELISILDDYFSDKDNQTKQIKVIRYMCENIRIKSEYITNMINAYRAKFIEKNKIETVVIAPMEGSDIVLNIEFGFSQQQAETLFSTLASKLGYEYRKSWTK